MYGYLGVEVEAVDASLAGRRQVHLPVERVVARRRASRPPSDVTPAGFDYAPGPMVDTGEPTHARDAHDAMARHAWADALAHFEAVDAAGAPAADDLRAYARAATWCNRPELAIELLGRACTALTAQGDRGAAADVALSLAFEHRHRRELATSMGWLRKAERTLADLPEHRAHGHLAWARSMEAQGKGDLDAALEQANRALAIGERTGDRDGQALALVRKGRVLVKQGHVADGMAHVDEAMVAAVSGELSPQITGQVYCATIDACHELCDYDRAGEWTEAARRWCERKAITGFPGICRVHRAELLRLRGKWLEAETEALRATEELRAFGAIDISGDALYEIGEIRLRMGDLDSASDAFRQAQELGREPQPGLALLWLERGKADTAHALIGHALADLPREDRLRRLRLLPAQVEIALAAGDLVAATAATDELDGAALAFATPGIGAAASTARGALQVATGDPAGAIMSLRRAGVIWKQLDAPYESAQARLLLARAYRAQGDEEAATVETKAAAATLERLGAVLALSRTADASRTPAASVTEAQADSPPAAGDVIDDRIELLRLIGGGGMGIVFEARNRRTGRHVAVKLLRRALCTDPEACQRLLQEALACGRIQHPNVVDVYDAGLHRHQPYLVMELLRGESFGARLDRDGKIAVAEATRVVQQALAGLGAAHRAGIVHRDIKPDNLFVTEPAPNGDALVKVLDFGISKLIGPESRLADTKTGMIVGTPYYMSPEQAMGRKDVDHRTDIYGLGAVLFHALTGRPPFEGDNYNALLAAILTTDAPRPRSLRSEIPLALEAVILRAMARDPAIRYASADELATDLSATMA